MIEEKKLPELVILKSGLLSFPELHLELDPRLLTPKQCRTALGDYKNAEEWDVGTGYYWQYYKVLFGGFVTYLSFCFYGTQFSMLAMDASLPTDKLENNWPTEESMRLKVKFFKEIFTKQFGGKLGFGIPYHVLDQRSYSAACGISYQKYIKELRYSVEMQKKRQEFTDFVQINSIGINFHKTIGVRIGNTLVSDRDEHYTHKQAKCKNEKDCLEMTLATIKEFQDKGYKIKKTSGKATAYDLLDPSEL